MTITILLTSDRVCPKEACRKRSICHGLWFFCHHLILENVLTISFLWSANEESHKVTEWTEVDDNTTVDWCHLLHEETQYKIIDNHELISYYIVCMFRCVAVPRQSQRATRPPQHYC